MLTLGRARVGVSWIFGTTLLGLSADSSFVSENVYFTHCEYYCLLCTSRLFVSILLNYAAVCRCKILHIIALHTFVWNFYKCALLATQTGCLSG